MKNLESTAKVKQNTLSNISGDLLQRHLSSFQNNNLDALIADYTNESVLVTPDSSYKGPEEIKSFFTDLFIHFPKKESNFELDKMVVSDDLVYIIWHGVTPSLDVPFATDTFIIKNGKIHQQTFAGQLKFKNGGEE
jgi:ketosteroid isomerase-like protein